MEEIRAFVGHSFSQDDVEVVGCFLKYFTQLSSNSHLNFAWEHAEAAEPKVVAEKVMSIIANKNVFIGICTKRERVIQQASFKPSNRFGKIFSKSRWFYIKEEQCCWKTSDWIMQEIGLAKGRNLDIILLIESGLEVPRGLQGDLEYIPFDRAAPEKSFGKIFEMITALSPKSLSTSAMATGTQSVADDEQKASEPPNDEDWWTPKPEWTRITYEIAFWYMMEQNKALDAEAINKVYLTTENASQYDNKIVWEASCEYTRLVFGKGGSLANLKALAEAHPNNSEARMYLAQGYEKYKDYRQAAHSFTVAAEVAHDDMERLKMLEYASRAYIDAGALEDAAACTNQMRACVQTPGVGEAQLLNSLKEIAEAAQENEILLAIMERMMALDPSDTRTRFSLAYKHSQVGNNDLALFHYLRIPSREREPMAWNNLGVAFDRLTLSAKAVQAYRKAEDAGEALAMTNLAQKFITAGFLPEAQQQCDAALKIEEYDKNILPAMTRLKEQPDEEDKKEAELLEKTSPISDFYIELGHAVSRVRPNALPQYWQGPDCILGATLQGFAFDAIGSYETLTLGLVSVFSTPRPMRYQVEYHGFLRGCAIEAHVIRKREGEVNSLLSPNGYEAKVLMILSEDGNEFRVMERTQGASPRFYILKREPSV